MTKVRNIVVSPVFTVAAAVLLLTGDLYDTTYANGTDCRDTAYSFASNCGALFSDFARDGTGWQLGGTLDTGHIWLRVGIRF
jgi:hypothetical protein